jgi:hypothetical protein
MACTVGGTELFAQSRPRSGCARRLHSKQATCYSIGGGGGGGSLKHTPISKIMYSNTNSCGFNPECALLEFSNVLYIMRPQPYCPLIAIGR